MENKSSIQMSMEDYNKIKASIDSITREEELIETHKGLIGKSCKDKFSEEKDCGVSFIKHFLSRNWGRSIVYQYSEGAQKFINSEYLSNYFKESIKELALIDGSKEKVLNIVNSNKKLNEMSKEELTIIYSFIKEFYAKNSDFDSPNVSGTFMSLMHKLDSKEASEFIKATVNKQDLASYILSTNGMVDRASYYSGRGVQYSDLSEKNLVGIFEKLLKLDTSYALEFVEMVNKMETLGATEFITAFMEFAYNDFKAEKVKTEQSNVSLDGVYGEGRDIVAALAIFTAMSRGDDRDYQIRASENMKNSFMTKISPDLYKINPNYSDDGCGPIVNSNGYWKRLN